MQAIHRALLHNQLSLASHASLLGCFGNTFARANGTPPSRRNRGKMKFSAAGPARTYARWGHYGNTFARANRDAGLSMGARLTCAPLERLTTE